MVSTASRRPIHLTSLDIANESFHEVRPSFKDLVTKFEHNKGSFTYAVTKNTSIRAMMQTKKSIRSINSHDNKSNNSLYSLKSINSLSFLDEVDDVDMNEENEEEEEDECEALQDTGNKYTKEKYVHIETPVKEEMEKRAQKFDSNKVKKPKTAVFATRASPMPTAPPFTIVKELGVVLVVVVAVGVVVVIVRSFWWMIGVMINCINS